VVVVVDVELGLSAVIDVLVPVAVEFDELLPVALPKVGPPLVTRSK
jgi:hypothetical protein